MQLRVERVDFRCRISSFTRFSSFITIDIANSSLGGKGTVCSGPVCDGPSIDGVSAKVGSSITMSVDTCEDSKVARSLFPSQQDPWYIYIVS